MTAGDSDGIAPLLRGGGPWRGRSSRAARSAKGQQEGLGTSYLGNGLNGIAAALMAYEFLVFFASMGSYARPGLVLVAWFLLAASFATVVITIRTSGDRLPTLAYAAFLLGIAGAVVLDLIAVVEPGSAAVAPTAAVAAAVAHAAMIVHRRSIEILAVALVVGVAELVTFGAMSPGDPTSFSVRVSALVVTIAPAVVVVVMMRGFRRMVQHEIDRALVQSTTLGPRYAVGMLASEELARLDLAAERLLAEVGDGSTPLPLDAHRAALAASLATQLRLHLIEGDGRRGCTTRSSSRSCSHPSSSSTTPTAPPGSSATSSGTGCCRRSGSSSTDRPPSCTSRRDRRAIPAPTPRRGPCSCPSFSARKACHCAVSTLRHGKLSHRSAPSASRPATGSS
ncbi:hypothetical protein Q0F99_00850 [Rathayibacter oskolensis]|uniref:hypothetical protein n=1 Tax=Rathayibacter oskolensis TaxID=1891671 RepID=UPI00265FD1AF|nr:hypothetical protein [Rathayibacter oskolensis]WKK71781.1 hypothetical protein Q0F99_00850 [Rathayibacter oskolensis]